MRERFVNLCDKNEAASYQLILIRAGNCCFLEFSDLSVTVRQADEACHRIPDASGSSAESTCKI